MSFSSWSSSGFNFFRGWRSMPGTIPATSQLDWLISITTMSVLSWFRAVKDRLRSFDCSMGRSKGLLDSAESAMPSPLAPYHLRVRTQDQPANFKLQFAIACTAEVPAPLDMVIFDSARCAAKIQRDEACAQRQHSMASSYPVRAHDVFLVVDVQNDFCPGG